MSGTFATYSFLSFVLFILSIVGVVSGQDTGTLNSIGDADCVIRSEDACSWITETLGYDFVAGGGGGGKAWGCYIDNAGKGRWDGGGTEAYAVVPVEGGTNRIRIFGDNSGRDEYKGAKQKCLGLNFVGDYGCFIRSEADCQQHAETAGLTYQGITGEGGNAWGCFINGNNEAVFDGSMDSGGQEQYDALDLSSSENGSDGTRIFCPLEKTEAPTITPSPTETPLDVKWDISTPNVTTEGLSMTFTYELNTNIEASQISYEVYDKGCSDGGVVLTTGFIKGNITGNVTEPKEVPVAVDTETIKDPSVPEGVWFEIDGLLIVEYCVYLALLSEDGSTEINYLETVLSVTYDLTTNTTIGTSLSIKGPSVSEVSKGYALEAYKCVPGTGTPLDDATAGLAIGQGSLITICVKPTAAARSDGIEMLSIDSFQWIRGATNLQPPVVQFAIESGQPASNGLTSYDDTACAGSTYCEVSSILFASFFATAGEVSGVGIGTMRFSMTEDGVVTGQRNLLREGRREEESVASTQKDADEGRTYDQQKELSFRALQQSGDTSSDFEVLVPVKYGSQDTRNTLLSAATTLTATTPCIALAITTYFVQ